MVTESSTVQCRFLNVMEVSVFSVIRFCWGYLFIYVFVYLFILFEAEKWKDLER